MLLQVLYSDINGRAEQNFINVYRLT